VIIRKPVFGGLPVGYEERALDPPRYFSGRYRGGLMTGDASGPNATQLLSANQGWPAIAERPIAQRLGSLTMELTRTKRVRKGTVEEEILDEHPLLDALQENPIFSLRQTLMLLGYWLSRGGDAYILKVTDGLRLTRSIWPLPPNRMEMVTDPDEIISGWIFHSDAGEYRYDPSEIVRIWSPNPANPFAGVGALQPQALSYDTDLFLKQTHRSFYENDATPKVIMTAQPNSRLPDAETMKRFNKDWKQRYHNRNGTDQGAPAMTPPGFAVEVIDAFGGIEDQAELAREVRDRLMMSYGTPRSVVGDVVDANRAAAETNQFVFDLHTIQPLAMLIEDSFTKGLAWDYEKALKLRFCEFVAQDKEFLLKQEAQDLTAKVRSVNQVREDRGLDPVPWGEEPIGTMADYPYDPDEARDTAALAQDDPNADEDPEEEAKDTGPEKDTEDDEEKPRGATVIRLAPRRVQVGWRRVVQSERRHAPPMERALREVLARQRDAVLATLQRGARAATPEVLLPDEDWRALFNRTTAPVRRKAYAESAEDALKDVGAKGFRLTPTAVKQLEKDGARMVSRVNSTTRARLRRALAAGTADGDSIDGLVKRIRDVFRARRDQARTIARTEVHRAVQRGQIEGFRQSGVVEKKQWNTSQDDAVRDSHLIDGQIVRLDEPFELDDGELADSPGEGADGTELSAHNAINCRCFVTPAFEED